jgi:membrane fusion protein (multidrug efflux system)
MRELALLEIGVRILLDGDASKLGRLRPGLSVTAGVDRRPNTDRAS